MAILEQAQVGDIGTILRLTVYDGENVADISNATIKTIEFKPKNGIKIIKTASFTTNGVDGKIECVIAEHDFDVAGIYFVQGIVTTPSGNWHTSIKQITVNKNL